MKFAVFGLHRGSSTDPDTLQRRARRAEELGFESLWVGDHIALPRGVKYDADEARLEALTTLTYLAAITTRVKLGVGVIVLPQRQPVLLAKQLTTLDTLSKGRLIFGIGVGYVEPELTALGASLADRGARTDEYLAVAQALWRADPTFAGQFVRYADVLQTPRPVQRPHPPVVVGGTSEAAYRRTVQSANGWYGFDMDVSATAAALADLRAARERYERPAELGDLEITITPATQPDLATARQFGDLGVHRLAIHPQVMVGTEMDDLIETVASTLIGRV